ncbi:LPXTG cell wall anchor domain-containing protein [Streptomyces canus]|uniref:LPXTG cell wall anchor domain-containing protein n=1 Tax=Streptomyces canus TaxID=58343 RepID=UPI00324C1357
MTSRLTEPLLWGLAGTGLRRAGAGQGSQRLTRLRAAGRQAHVRCRAELRLITCAVAGAVGAGALLIGGALVFFVRRRKA